MDVAAACGGRARRVTRVGAVGARCAGLKTRARLAPVAEPRVLSGDEANADGIVIAAKREIVAGPTCASHALAVQTRLTYRADDRFMDAPSRSITRVDGAAIAVITIDVHMDAADAWIARIRGTGIVVIAVECWSTCANTGYACVVRGAGVAVFTCAAFIRRLSLARSADADAD